MTSDLHSTLLYCTSTIRRPASGDLRTFVVKPASACASQAYFVMGVLQGCTLPYGSRRYQWSVPFLNALDRMLSPTLTPRQTPPFPSTETPNLLQHVGKMLGRGTSVCQLLRFHDDAGFLRQTSSHYPPRCDWCSLLSCGRASHSSMFSCLSISCLWFLCSIQRRTRICLECYLDHLPNLGFLKSDCHGFHKVPPIQAMHLLQPTRLRTSWRSNESRNSKNRLRKATCLSIVWNTLHHFSDSEYVMSRSIGVFAAVYSKSNISRCPA